MTQWSRWAKQPEVIGLRVLQPVSISISHLCCQTLERRQRGTGGRVPSRVDSGYSAVRGHEPGHDPIPERMENNSLSDIKVQKGLVNPETKLQTWQKSFSAHGHLSLFVLMLNRHAATCVRVQIIPDKLSASWKEKGKQSVLAALRALGCDVYFGPCFHHVLLVRHDEITQCRKEVVHEMSASSGSKKLQ